MAERISKLPSTYDSPFKYDLATKASIIRSRVGRNEAEKTLDRPKKM